MTSNRGDWLKLLAIVGLSALAGTHLTRRAMKGVVATTARRLASEPLERNLWMLASSIQRQGPHALVENELRAEHGRVIQRPIGGARSFPYFDKLMFDAPQMRTMPAPTLAPVDMSVTIGPRAARPLLIQVPILIAGMGHGLALSESCKLALARGADAVGTATNTGFGPFLISERKAARRLIVQYSRAPWSDREKALKQADAVEIGVGQGGNAGLGMRVDGRRLNPVVLRHMGLPRGRDPVIESRLPGVNSPRELKDLIQRLKKLTRGVPVGVKYAAGKHLEDDLRIAVDAGADFVSVDGAEAGSHQGPPLLQDDFGLPTLIAAARAGSLWRREGLKGEVTLLVGGGLFSPGACLKVLALGADAVYLGSAILMAASHKQAIQVTIPFEPPTQLAYEVGRLKHRFDVERGARSVANFLRALAEEMEVGVRALGKTRIGDVGRSDLVALDRDVAEMTGVDLAFYPAGGPGRTPEDTQGRGFRREPERAGAPRTVPPH